MQMIYNKYQFINFISLGYFCDVASDLEKLGLRSYSYPFDWNLTSLDNNIKLIENNFEDFLNIDNIKQLSGYPNRYVDIKYNVFFYHDFVSYKSLEEQLPSVKEKYQRRINRFYKDIKNPTLFVRYISSEFLDNKNESDELNWIEKNITYINKTIKSFNSNNEILFIANEGIKSNLVKIHNVLPEFADNVCHNPITTNNDLYNLFKTFSIPNKDKNIMFYQEKQNKKNSSSFIFKSKLKNKFIKLFLKDYIHNKIY